MSQLSGTILTALECDDTIQNVVRIQECPITPLKSPLYANYITRYPEMNVKQRNVVYKRRDKEEDQWTNGFCMRDEIKSR
jgi:hypothetical protein